MFLEKAFPQSRNRNIAIYYLLTAFSNAWFIAGNWIFFWTRFLTFGQLGIVDATAFAFGLFMEVPTGAVADLIGKKKTIFLSMLFSFVGITFFVTPSNSMWPLLIGFLISQAGWALYSGSAEALAYDTLKEHHQEEDFDKVMSRANMIGILMTVIATLLGGLMYIYWFRLPHLAWGTMSFLGIIASLYLTEPKVDTEKFSLKNYLAQLGQGVKQLLQPTLRHLLPIIFSLSGFYFLYNFGLIKPVIATNFGFFANEQAVVWATIGLITAVAAYFIPHLMEKLDDKVGLIILNLLMGIGFLATNLNLGWVGFFILLLISVVGSISSPWISVVVNREIESRYRATTISTIALASKIPYVLAAIVAGNMIDRGIFWMFNAAIGAIILVFTLQTFLSKKT